jgi:VWFA-related protein
VAGQFYWRMTALAVGVAAALMVIAVTVLGQAQNSAQQGVSPKQALVDPVKLVQIDVVVTDKDGKFVAGLGPQNFALKEEGRPQVLTGVDHFVVAAYAAKGGTGAPPSLIDLETAQNPEKLRPMLHNRRLIIMFFALATMTSGELQQSADASRKFVKEQMTAADLVAVVSFGRVFKIDADFTNDRELLGRALDSLLPSGAGIDVNPSAEEVSFNILHADNLLYAVEALSKLLSGIPGRKSVIQFTGSVPQFDGITSDVLTAATNVANENVVPLYDVDLSDSTGPGAGEPVMEDPGDPGKFAGVMRSRKVLESLAHDTGGKLFTDVKDFAPIFKQVEDDSQDYYLLSYYSSNWKRDGLFRNVSVKLEKVRGAQIKFRPGYYAPKDFPTMNPQRH